MKLKHYNKPRLTFLIIILMASGIIGISAQRGPGKPEGWGATDIALLKYRGGGDWYANPTSLPNLVSFCNRELHMDISPDPPTVDVASPEIFNYAFLHMTGHGNVVFNREEKENLRKYLMGGGFLHIDDNYGMDPYARKAIGELFPGETLIELPFEHPVFHQNWDFNQGLPKIHEHDGKPPQAFGIIVEGRLLLLYSYESDLGDGWEDADVHNDSKKVRTQALRMGANILEFVFTQ